MNVDPPAVHTLRGDVPRAISSIVDRALEKEPDSRYQNMKEILADLRLTRRELKI